MIDEGSALALVLVLSILALLFFIIYYRAKISSFNLETELYEGEGNHDSMGQSEYLLGIDETNSAGSEKNKIDVHKFNIKMINKIERLKDASLRSETLASLGTGIIFSFFVVFVLEEFIGSFYITIAFYVGLILAIVFNTLLTNVAIKAQVQMLFASSEGEASVFSFAYFIGLSVSLLVVGVISILYVIMFAIYRRIYIENGMRQEYENLLLLLLGGLTLGFSFGTFSSRVAGGVFSAGVNIGSELIGSSESEFSPEKLLNPCSVALRVADLKNVTAPMMDLINVFMITLLSYMVLSCQSEDLTKEKGSFYIPFVFFSFNILIATVSSILGPAKKIFISKEAAKYAALNCRLQVLLSEFLTLFVVVLVPFYFSGEIVFGTKVEGVSADKPLLAYPDQSFQNANYQQIQDNNAFFFKTTDRLGMVLCCLMGYISQIFLIIFSELFTSHNFFPTRHLVEINKSVSGLNLSIGNIFSGLAFVIAGMVLFVALLVSHIFAGYFGVALCAIGLLSNSIVFSSISFASACTTGSFKLAGVAHLKDVNKCVKKLSWAMENYTIHVKIIVFGSFFFASIAAIGAYVRHINDKSLLIINSYSLVGLCVAVGFLYLMYSILLIGVQYLGKRLYFSAKSELSKIEEIKKGIGRIGFSVIFDDIRSRTNKKIIVPTTLNFLVILLSGMLFGNHLILGFLISSAITGSFIIVSSLISGHSLKNARILAESEREKEKDVFKASLMGDIYSAGYRDAAGPALLSYLSFNIALTLLANSFFTRTSYLKNVIGLQ